MSTEDFLMKTSNVFHSQDVVIVNVPSFGECVYHKVQFPMLGRGGTLMTFGTTTNSVLVLLYTVLGVHSGSKRKLTLSLGQQLKLVGNMQNDADDKNRAQIKCPHFFNIPKIKLWLLCGYKINIDVHQNFQSNCVDSDI